jgi:hypothetical protein
MEATMTGKLSPEGEVIAAYGAAMVAAFQVLINCLEENGAVLPGQIPGALDIRVGAGHGYDGAANSRDRGR